MKGEIKLPAVCRFGQTALERKLLLYLDAKASYPIELRCRDSSLYNRDDIPTLEHPFEFVPIFEIGLRVFMFKTVTDRNRARKALENVDKTKVRRKRKSRR